MPELLPVATERDCGGASSCTEPGRWWRGSGLNEGEPPSGGVACRRPNTCSEVLVCHGNARLTFHGRKLTVERHRAGWRQAQIAAAMGVSRKCVRTWITRYEAEGDAG